MISCHNSSLHVVIESCLSTLDICIRMQFQSAEQTALKQRFPYSDVILHQTRPNCHRKLFPIHGMSCANQKCEPVPTTQPTTLTTEVPSSFLRHWMPNMNRHETYNMHWTCWSQRKTMKSAISFIHIMIFPSDRTMLFRLPLASLVTITTFSAAKVL